jgi:1-aminocyclopropane-1-carboxylate deaminase/D-cysteine desulfhydrase-like pyridoxal-dependent ACC family enzyme
VPQGPITLCLPSPTRQLRSEGNRELWVKDDGAVCADYGGNKPRKLVRLLEQAQKSHAQRLVTIGAVGSHHVLATGILGRKLGFSTTALSLPRPYSYHAEQTTRRSLSAEVELISVASLTDLPRLIRCLVRRGNYWIPPGGSNAMGTLGYLDALLELENQVRNGELPEPDVIFVALGTGGTAAGILAGLARSTLRSRLVAIPILHLPNARYWVEDLAKRALRLSGHTPPANLTARLEIDARWIGKGYGTSTPAGETAIGIAAETGLSLESTYTGKAFAAALEWLSGALARDYGGAPLRALFWSTIATTKDSTTDEPAVTLSPAIARLLRAKPKTMPGKDA